ncbi:MAG: HAMP domain-containing protein [Alicyclobacillus herbarius]|uniref:sensor histidine kinase n=1 Tax=Alicyclobacillus herbarius TaxID=122960 RepID=UPI002353FCC9|nr:ATP-binding protein [Alicyclobacillus herbarius]MCL6631452.1 HAMP domain-containing protein [Alicyclobacillus herbarius]
MKVRNKIFLGIASLVLFLAAVDLLISYTYFGGLFRKYAQAAEEGTAEQWAQSLAYYYHANHDSWTGVDEYISGIFQQGESVPSTRRLDQLVLEDAGNHVIVVIGHPGPRHAPVPPALGHDGEVEVPVTVGNQVVGHLWIRDRGLDALYAMKQTVVHSMTVASVAGTVLTVGIALVVGAWFSRRLTRPLHRIMKAIHRIGEGQLQTQLPIDSRDEYGEVAQAFNDMAARLHKTEEARRHLVADVAHELRIPLTIMQGQLELIQQGVKPAGPETLLPIHDEVIRLTRLVQDLHQLTLAEVGQLPLQIQPTALDALLARIVDNFQVEAEVKQVQLTFASRLEQGVCSPVDPDRITQVFVNLIGNALRYTPKGGCVRVETQLEGDQVVVSVQDSGPGIAPEHLPYVFDRFYRGEADRSRESGGTGLGLAIAKEFVEAHQGQIDVRSTPGHGTTFIVRLPLGTPEPDRSRNDAL